MARVTRIFKDRKKNKNVQDVKNDPGYMFHDFWS